MKTQKRVFRGTVRNVNYKDLTHICTFRLEQLDETGDISGHNVVEVFNVLTDIAAEGDTVEVFGTLRNGSIRPQHIHNLTTGKTLKTSGLSAPIFFVLFWCITGLIFVGVFFLFIKDFFEAKPELNINSLNDCTIQVQALSHPPLRSQPSVFDGHKVGELEPENSYPATQRARKKDGFDGGTWFYIDADNTQGWVSDSYGFSAVGNCGN